MPCSVSHTPCSTPGRRDTRPKVHLTMKYNPTTSVVSIVVHRVTNLNETSHTFLPNPYVKTYLVEVGWGW